MPSASIKKIIPCKKKDLVNMILDIEKYPEFVPWCLNGKIHKKNEMADIIELEADLTVGKKFLNQTYKSHVAYYKDKGKIIVNNIGGPLKHLQNEWLIREINNQSEINFKIDFEIKNIVYNMIMSKSFDQGLKKIADAFEKRAIQLFKVS
jgi:coenzyme Q-binding protein COQ10